MINPDIMNVWQWQKRFEYKAAGKHLTADEAMEEIALAP
jgi:hypothetical protein